MTVTLLLAVMLLVAPPPSQAGVLEGNTAVDGSRPPRRIQELSLEELLDLRTSVATRVERSLREVPGIITVITREEMLDLGARDLVDVLQLVPGLHLAVDAQNMVGIGVRGIWGQEGKVLLLLDGQHMNEPFYDCLGLGAHFPVDQLARVEIIRGPGSVTYGGLAELAVINLVSQSAEQIGGASARATWGQYPSGWGRRTVSVQAATSMLDDRIRASVSGYLGQARRSDATFTDFNGNTFPMASGARTDPAMLNLSLKVDDLALRLLYDGYAVGSRDGMGTVVPPVRTEMSGWFAEARWPTQVTPALTLTPELRFRRQYPWRVRDAASPMFFDKTADHWEATLHASWKPTDSVEVVSGASTAWNQAWAGPADTRYLRGGDRADAFRTAAAFAELLYEGLPANLSAGARYEYHQVVGGSFVPRIALTRVLGAAHLKLLYAEAFRTPGFGNLALSTGIRPERTRVGEAEIGYRIGDWASASANVFDIAIDRPIVYWMDPATNAEGYRNGDRTGTRGFEVEARLRLLGGWWTFGYSFYSAAGLNRVADYVVPNHPELTRAFPRHKVTLTGRIPVGPVRLAPSLVLTSDRFAELRGDLNGDPVVGNAGALVQVGVNATWRDAFWPGLDVSAGVHNAFNRPDDFLHPYPGHTPLPGPRREITFQIAWQSPQP